MRISVKGRYALAAMIHLGEHESSNCIPVVQIAEQLDISKIYLEQVFALLKRGKLVESIKGAGGGYRLSMPATQITLYEIMKATEAAIFEETKETVGEKAPALDQVLSEVIFMPLDETVRALLSNLTLADLMKRYEEIQNDNGYMFFI